MSNNSSKILTYTGKLISPVDPDPNEIDIVDIAHALSMMCRFGGHSNEFYSVAQHSYLCSLLTEDLNLAIVLLLHDASEAYIHDIITPLKPYISSYKDIENTVMQRIFEKFDLKWPLSDEYKKKVKDIDNIMLLTEFKNFMSKIPDDCEIAKHYKPLDLEINANSPEIAKINFISRFKELVKRQ